MAGNDPIFRTVGQALYVAYVIEVTPLTQKGGTQIVIEDIMRRGGYQSEVKVRSDRNINLAGMTPLEFRAQCAIVRQAVDALDAPHRHSLHARYGRQQTRASGVKGLAELLGPLCNSRKDSAISALIWAIYDEKGDWSLRRLEREFGVGKNTLHRDQLLLRKLTQRWQSLGEHNLDTKFTNAGLVGEY